MHKDFVMHCSTIEQPIVGGRSEKQALGEQSSTLVVTSSASFVSALRAESAVAPLLLLSPANPLTLGFPGAPKADSPLYTKGPLVRTARNCAPFLRSAYIRRSPPNPISTTSSAMKGEHI